MKTKNLSSNYFLRKFSDKKSKRSRLDLLFARFSLEKKKYGEAIKKLTNSIILYSEIYGPESVGLTPHYYYLSIYFAEESENNDKTEDKRDIIVKNIYLKIADMWKKYFTEDKNILFVSKFVQVIIDDPNQELNFIVGDTYVKKILHKLRHSTQKDLELELKFKIIKALILKELHSELFTEALSKVNYWLIEKVNELKDSYNMPDRSFMEELYENKLNKSIVNQNISNSPEK